MRSGSFLIESLEIKNQCSVRRGEPMGLWLLRVLFVAIMAATSYYFRPFSLPAVPHSLIFGGLLGVAIVVFELRVRRLSLKMLVGAAVGSIAGILGASLISLVLSRMTFFDPPSATFLQVLILAFMTYVGLILGVAKGENLSLEEFLGDRSGRKFAKILANDFNLNKVAQLRGVEVLNINELANAIKPVVLPGESMRVFILKEGKEYNQGVAYLDDGTMVVVDNARKMIGKTIDILVTSVLQTTAGKMIFGKFAELADNRVEFDRDRVQSQM